jgi:hypothetical protein
MYTHRRRFVHYVVTQNTAKYFDLRILSAFVRVFISKQSPLQMAIHCYYTLLVVSARIFNLVLQHSERLKPQVERPHCIQCTCQFTRKCQKWTGNFCISFSTLFSHKQTIIPLHARKREKSKWNMHTAHNICTKVRTFGNCKVSASQWNITSKADAMYTPATTRKLD